jgi:hypothetical protein
MNTPPPPFDPSDDADEQYRRASELDPSRPSEATRRAVLEHAARLAAERSRRGARRRWLPLAGVTLRWQAIVGTVAAASLAGVMIAPRFFSPAAPPAAREAPQQPASAPAPVESVHPVSPPVTFEHPRNLLSARGAPRRESAPAEAVPAAAAPAPGATDSMTRLQLEQRAANAAPASALAQEAVASTGAQRPVVPAPAAAASRAASVRPPPSAVPRESAGPEALRQAAAAGDLAALKSALAGTGDIDARDAEGRTALMLATLNGQADAVAELLARGADPSGADARGTTPLQAAVAADERDVIALLRRYGAR